MDAKFTNTLRKLDNEYTRIFVLALVNIIFYLASFTSVLSFGYIFALIIFTSVFEILIFIVPCIKSKILRLLLTLVYFAFSFSKIFMSINFLQYGNCDIFSRSSQMKYLKDTLDYFLMQINSVNISLFLLSLLGAILIYHNKKFDLGKYKYKFVLLALSCVILAIVLGKNMYFEYYRTMAYSYFDLYEKPLLDEDEMEQEIDEAIKKSVSDYNSRMGLSDEILSENEGINLFKSYKNRNKFTGIFKDKNILIIQVESLQNAFINREYHGEEICPNLNRLLDNSIYFNDYFELIGYGNSSDSEYVSLNSTYSNLKYGAYIDYSVSEVLGLPEIAKLKGYSTISMHGNSGDYYGRAMYHPNIGFDASYFGEFYEQDEIIGMGLSDESFFRQSVPVLEGYKDEKWVAFLITTTCHIPYNMPEKYEYFDTPLDSNFSRYLNAVHYGDAAIGEFLSSLDEKGMLDNTVVVIYGDHHALSVRDAASAEDLSEFLGYDFAYDEMLNIPLIIYSKDMGMHLVKENIGSQLDLMPTLMNLMDWNDVATPMFGVDLLDENMTKDNVVYSQIYIPWGSYITDEEIFVNTLTGEKSTSIVDRKSGEQRLSDTCENIRKKGEKSINLANYIYENNKVRYVLDEFKRGIKKSK